MSAPTQPAAAPEGHPGAPTDLEVYRQRVAADWAARNPDFEFELDWQRDDERIAAAEWSRGLDCEYATRMAQDAYETQLRGRS